MTDDRPKWVDLFGIDPGFTGDQSTDEYLAASRDERPTLAHFLSVRILEDLRVAVAAGASLGGDGRAERWTEQSSGVLFTGDDYWTIADSSIVRLAVHFDPARIMADYEAKRQAVLIAERAMSWDPDLGEAPPRQKESAWAILKALGVAYADHPDYRDEWRPDA